MLSYTAVRDVNKTSTFKTKTKTPDLKTWTKTAHGTKQSSYQLTLQYVQACEYII